MSRASARAAVAPQMPGARVKSRRLKTDAGTVVLHWAMVVALGVALVTGLAISIDHPDRTWLRALAGVLPGGDVWTLHIGAGATLLGIGVAYAIYLARTGLSRRVRIDRTRLYGLIGASRARAASVNAIVSFAALVLLAVQLVTGLLLYLGHGGLLVTVHYVGALALALFPLVHIAAQLAHGGVAQLLRIVRPTRRLEVVSPPDLAVLIREHLERTERPAAPLPARPPADSDASRRPEPRTLHAHPLAVAGLVGLATVGLAASIDLGARDRLVVSRIAPGEAPRLDGDSSDPVWRRAREVVVDTQQGVNLGGNGASRVTIRALHDGTWAFVVFTWEDPTRSLKHLPLVKRQDGWHLLHERYDIEDESRYYEDKFSVMLAESARLPAAGTTHMGERPLPGKPPAYSGRGLHYTTDGSIVDVWHWKAARGGLTGGIDDNHFGPPAEPKPKEIEGKSRYKAGYGSDPGRAPFANNFASEPAGGYRKSLTPKRLPKSLSRLAEAMGPVDLDPDASEAAGARWWLTNEESHAYDAELDRLIPVGTVIPGVLLDGGYDGDRGDVRGAAQWAAGRWTLEVARRLDTGSRFDVAIRSGIAVWVAVFDHTQTRHTRHVRPVILEVAP